MAARRTLTFQTLQEDADALDPQSTRFLQVVERNSRRLHRLVGDGDRLGQMLDNIVSNAVKFTAEGGTVDVYLARRGDKALLEVRDSGIGIPDEEQDRLFQRFFRSSTATERAIPGVGLGLTISRAIVEAHGGTIGFESEEGRGTTFRVELPLGAQPSVPDPTESPREVVL
jgi:signal transduction histidine kinase